MDAKKIAEMDAALQGAGVDPQASSGKFAEMDALLAGQGGPQEGEMSSEALEVPEPSPLDFMQNLIMGFAPDDQTRVRFLQDEFKGAKVDRDTQGNIRINGARINPQGFDLGDVVRSAGYALPVGGQLAGGVLGAAGGTAAAPGPGSVAGSMAGGMAGAAGGETVRQGLGVAMGLRPTAESSLKSLGSETALAAAGEVTMLGAKTAVRASGLDKMAANAWRGVMKKLGQAGPKVVQFVGGVDPNATQIAMKHGVEDTLNDTFFDANKTAKIAQKVLFGQEVNAVSLGNTNTVLNGMQEGTALIAKSIADVDDPAFTQLIKQFTGITDESIQAIKTNGTKELLSGTVLKPSRAAELAESITHSIDLYDSQLGKAVGAARNKAIRAAGDGELVVGDIASRFKNEVNGLGLITPLKTPAGMIPALSRVPGGNELIDMIHQLGRNVPVKSANGEISHAFVFFGQELPKGHTMGKRTFLPNLDARTAVKIEERLGVKANALFNSKVADSKLKKVAANFLSNYRKRLDNQLGLGVEEKAFSEFRDLATSLRLSRDTATNSLETRIRNFRFQNDTYVQELRDLLTRLPKGKGEKFLQSIDLVNTGDELKKLNSIDIFKRFEAELNNPELLNQRQVPAGEMFLRDADNAMKQAGKTNPAVRQRIFMDDAEKSLAAKEFMKGSPNLLRVQAVARLAGFSGALGYMTGGPMGGMLAAGASMSATNPRNIARFLVGMTKAGKGSFSVPPDVVNMLARMQQATPTLTSQMYRQSVIADQEKKKEPGKAKDVIRP